MRQIPYGLWKSPISEQAVAQRGRINTLKWGSNNRLYFSGNQGGNSFLYEYRCDSGLKRLNGDLPVGGNIGYGGGDFDVQNERVIFRAGKRGLYLQNLNKPTLKLLTNDRYMTASPVISPDGRFVAYVSGDGTDDQIALLRLDERSWPFLWIHGADFYMQPAWSPRGNYFTWVEWNHPDMPWDGSKVMIGKVDPENGTISEITHIAGKMPFPASQPKFSPDGKMLSYIRSNGEWEDLILRNLESGEEKILVHGDHFALTIPAFAQGVQTYDWFPDSRQLAFLQIFGTRSKICIVSVESGEIRILNSQQYSSFDTISVSPETGMIAAVADSPLQPTQIILINENEIKTVFRISDDLINEEYISKPREISWEAPDGTPVYGIFYPPTNPDAHWVGLPPAFVHIHGGPTGKADLRFNPEIQFFTSRGFGYLEVNYRGSCGYGTSYLQSLYGNWGVYDVEDAILGADCLSALRLADRNRLLIIGGSAGGFTVLNTLIQYPDSFKAAACLYGVTDLFGLAINTHKLELHYTDSLVGPLPEAAPVYEKRSPIRHVEKIKTPLAIFQGDADPVVIPSQSNELAARLKCPHVYRLYKEEGHGFRRPETITDYLSTLYSFATQYLL